jgi:hypothetical protein
MIPALTIIDGLLPNEVALAVRQHALEKGFKTFEYMQGVYQGTGLDCPSCISEALAQFVGGNGIKVAIQAFRSGHEKTDLHTNIHADNPVAKWAGVYFLNLPEQCQGGTAFYRLKETGWDEMPTQEQLDSVGKDIDWMRSKWSDESQWDRTSIAGMKFNRMIFYPTSYFHSRFPLKGWGPEDKPEEARLVFVIFFDII